MYERKISSKAYPRLTSSILINAKKKKNYKVDYKILF